MAWETGLLRRTSFGTNHRCLETLDAFAELIPWWQRGCLFLYAGMGTWIARRLGFDMPAMWRWAESVLSDMTWVTGLSPRQIAGLMHEFAKAKLRDSTPMEFDQAKATIYDRSFWPMVAHMAFAVQPSAIVRLYFAKQTAESIYVEDGRIADLGCGPGVILSNILARKPTWSGYGIDVSASAIAYATRYAERKGVGKRAGFAVADLSRLPYSDNSFDLIVASEVLEHIPDVRRALDELRRVLRPCGRVAITVPLHSRTSLHVNNFAEREDFARLCQGAGLTVRSFETRYFPGFGDDWRHAFVVAEADGDGLKRRPRQAELLAAVVPAARTPVPEFPWRV